jgi:DNA-binding winged helix-turn-helix (wHTH) protein
VQHTAYRFGSFALDLEQGTLLAADSKEIPLRPKSFALIQLLVENAGRLLSKEAIMEALWPNIFVTENNVSQCIHDIRAALGFEAYQILRTVPRRGYLFTSNVIAMPPRGAGLRETRPRPSTTPFIDVEIGAER